jgi:hypothetical protein
VSRLLGREPARSTVFERDGEGRLARAVTAHEPLWTDEDRGELLALLEEEADTCPGCGHPNSECRDRSSVGQWRLVSKTCWACLVLEADSEGRAESKQRQRGLYVGTIRSPGV